MSRRTPDPAVRRRRLSLDRSSFPVLVLIVALVVQLVVAIGFTREMWFVRDDWDYLTKRGTIPSADRGLFAPYGGHWVTGPVVLYRILLAVFGLRSYLPYALMTILLHLAIVVVLYLVLRRMTVGPWLAVSVSVVVTFLGAGAEAFLWDSTVPQMGSLFLGLVAMLVLALDELSRRRQLAAAALLCLAMAFSGFGLVVAVFAFVWLLGTQRLLLAARVVAPCLIIFVIWFLAVGDKGLPPHLAAADYLQVPLYVWTGLGSALSKASGVPYAGAAVLGALVLAVVLRNAAPAQLRCLAWAGIAAAVAQQALAAVTRLGFGLETAASSRYSYAVVLLLAPSLAVALCALVPWVAEPRWMAVALSVVLLAAYVPNSLQMEREFARFEQAASAQWKSRVAGLMAAVGEHERILTPVLSTPFDGDFDARLVADRRTSDELPVLRADGQERLDAENEFFVGVRTTSFDMFSPTHITGIAGFDKPFQPGPGCTSHTAVAADSSLMVETRNGTEIGVTGPATKVQTQLRRDSEASKTVDWSVRAGSLYVASSAKDADLVLTFDQPGQYVICTQ